MTRFRAPVLSALLLAACSSAPKEPVPLDLGDTRLAEDSAAREAELAQALEREAEPLEREAGTSEQEAEAVRMEARGYAEMWSASLQAPGDPETNPGAREAIAAALTSDDPAKVRGALSAIVRTSSLEELDRSDWYAPTRKVCEQVDPLTSDLTFYALKTVGFREGDHALGLAHLKTDPHAFGGTSSNLLMDFTGGAIEGEAARIALEMLAHPDRDVRREVLRGLWGAAPSAEVQDRVCELATDPDVDQRSDPIYFGLSTFENKTPTTIDVLLGQVQAAVDAGRHMNSSHRSFWGLGSGLDAESRERVADVIAAHLSKTDSASLAGDCLRLLERYGSGRHVAVIQALPLRDMTSSNLPTLAKSALSAIEERSAGAR